RGACPRGAGARGRSAARVVHLRAATGGRRRRIDRNPRARPAPPRSRVAVPGATGFPRFSRITEPRVPATGPSLASRRLGLSEAERLNMDRRGLLFGLALAGSLLADGVSAQNFLCTGEVDDRRVNGNLTVVGVCELEDVEVRGNVRVPAGSSFFASDVRVRGNLIVNRALAVNVSSSTIDGNVNFEEVVGIASEVSDTKIDGNVILERNRTLVELLANDIRGNVEVVLNTGGVGLTANRIRGALECEGNDPAPLLLDNRVDDGANGQCAALAPPSAPEPRP